MNTLEAHNETLDQAEMWNVPPLFVVFVGSQLPKYGYMGKHL